MVSHPETGSDPPIKSDRESGCDTNLHVVRHDHRRWKSVKMLGRCATFLW